jgi:hypothetical protein
MNSERWERTKEILEQALRLAAEERRAYLESACGSDADLRSEVESLIASHEEAPRLWHEARTVRDHRTAGRRRDGRGLPRAGHALDRMLRSRFCPPHSPQTRSVAAASSRKHARHLRSTIPIS